MTIGSLASAGSYRMRGLIGAHWNFTVRVLDVVYALGMFGTLGGLSALLNALTGRRKPPHRIRSSPCH